MRASLRPRAMIIIVMLSHQLLTGKAAPSLSPKANACSLLGVCKRVGLQIPNLRYLLAPTSPVHGITLAKAHRALEGTVRVDTGGVPD